MTCASNEFRHLSTAYAYTQSNQSHCSSCVRINWPVHSVQFDGKAINSRETSEWEVEGRPCAWLADIGLYPRRFNSIFSWLANDGDSCSLHRCHLPFPFGSSLCKHSICEWFGYHCNVAQRRCHLLRNVMFAQHKILYIHRAAQMERVVYFRFIFVVRQHKNCG